ncbi:adenylate kinase 7 isoform X2 [Takifugu rubripes]|uniref:adenylate kinase 7 isoform X2 n=1 Tax=Takifugu rubripes TaxID=31033 RepID=UPI00114602A6|nr:adenylate kinase 7 isoform X2 [Takifugu rubripes]
MAEDTAGSIPKRVFINSVDSYASRNIAKFLSERRLVSTYEEDETEEQERAFQLVGSADRRDGGSPHVLEVYSKANRDELLLKLMQCDVIIYNISEHADQVEEALWAVSALHGQMEQFAASKMFILISTVMTWALTEPLDPEDPTLPLTDELFWRRRPHPNFKSHCELEKRVVKLGKINKRVFSTYVVASGCLYGKGEQFLHYFFKTAWLGGQHEILLFGDGNNVIPMIHVIDLASVIQNVIEQPPLPGYLLAVDNSDNTLEEIVKMVASVLGSGTIQKKPFEEAFLIPDFSDAAMDNPDEDEEDDDSLEETRMLLSRFRESRDTDTLDEQFKVKVVRDRLLSKPCRNQGFVLDNFPVTRDQARELFSADGDNSEEPEEAPISSCSRRITPEFVFYLDASEEFLKARVKNLPESLIQEQDYQQEAFLQRLATFRMSRLKNETALEYFEEIDVAPVLLEVTSNEKLDTTLLMHKVFETIGQPRNYQLSPEVGQDKERKQEEKRVGKTGHEDALPSLWEKGCGEEDKQKAEGAGKWITRLEKVKLYEDKQLEAQSVPVRNYLMEHVMPTLTQGLIQCCRSQPQDPVDFLAEYLLRNNPFNS